METIKVTGVDCGGCAANIEKALKGVKGVEKIDVRLNEKIALVTFDPGQISKKEVTDRVEDVGYDVE